MAVGEHHKKKGAVAPKPAKKFPPQVPLTCLGVLGGECRFWGVGAFFPSGLKVLMTCHQAQRLARQLLRPGTTPKAPRNPRRHGVSVDTEPT